MNKTKRAEKILDTTVRLFLRDGIRKTTMDDIAEAAKVSKVTVYKYFTDKDTLYAHVGEHVFSDYTNRLTAVVASGEPLVKRMYAFIDVLSEFSDSGLYALCRTLATYNHAVDDEHTRYQENYRGAICRLIDEGIQNGLMHSGIDRELTYFYIDMGVFYYQNSPAYRKKISEDMDFQRKFLLFYIGNLFASTADILPAT